MKAAPFVSAASFYTELYWPGIGERRFYNPGTYDLGGVSSSLSGLYGGTLKAAGRGGSGYSHDSVAYTFAVVGPEDGVAVPLWFSFSLHASASGLIEGLPDSGAQALVSVYMAGGSLLDLQVAEGNVAVVTPKHELSGTDPFTMFSGRTAFVYEFVRADSGPHGGVADASVDPYIYIDPGFLATHPGYSVLVSAGVDNTPPAVAAVPEPATFGMAGLCLAVIAGMGLRTRGKAEGTCRN